MFKSSEFMFKNYRLKGNPFVSGATYAPEKQDVYDPAMYGHQHFEFRRKFFAEPLTSGRPIIGAIWSSARADPETRGYGKSTMMGEEAKAINRDFGLSTFVDLGADPKQAPEFPVLAGYVSFNTTAVNSIEAAGYHLVKDLVRDGTEGNGSTHSRLRKRLLKQLAQGARIQKRDEEALIEAALRQRARELAIQIEFKGELEKFLLKLCSADSVALSEYLAGVTSWHHLRVGVKFLQIYTCFATLAGIKHVTYFIDQVEDFTTLSSNAKILKNVKLIRDALLESEPFASTASFVFQLHPVAWTSLRTAWQHENLRDLGTESKQSEPYVVNLQGLVNFELAKSCATTYLNHSKYVTPDRQPGDITPFTEDAIRYVWENTGSVPREFIRAMGDLVERGRSEQRLTIDATFAASVLDVARSDAIAASPARRSRRSAGPDSRLA